MARVMAFAVAFFLLHNAYESTRDTAFERVMIDGLTVAPAAALVDAIAPDLQARAEGSRIVSRLVRLNIEAGCEGMETYLLLVAAVLCAGRGLVATLVGLLAGFVVIYCSNLARVVALYFAAIQGRGWFEWLHAYVAPLAVVAVAVVAFSSWLVRYCPKPAR
jgi:exosortase family protein XrtM